MGSRKIDFNYAPSLSWTLLCHPDDPFKSIVNEQGYLLYDHETSSTFRFRKVIQFYLQTDQKIISIRQQTWDAKTPIVLTEITYPMATLKLRTFSHWNVSERMDIVIWQIIPHPGLEGWMAGLVIEPSLDGKMVEHKEASHLVYTKSNAHQSQSEPPNVLFFSSPHRVQRISSRNFGPDIALSTEPVLLSEGEIIEGVVFFPLNEVDFNSSSYDLQWALQAEQKEKDFWSQFQVCLNPIQIPDPQVMDLYMACARNILQAREIKNNVPFFQVGPSIYRGLWFVDGYFILEAAQYLGFKQEAFQGLEAILQYVREDGAIAVFPTHIKETGIALATFVRQCELLGRDDKLRSLWPVMMRGVEYIQSLRVKSRERGAQSPEYGLMPPAFGDGGLFGDRPEYTTALWSLVGLKEMMRIADRIGFHEDRKAVEQAFSDLLQAFYEHAARDMRVLEDGTPYLPMLKPGSGDHTVVPYAENVPGPWVQANPGTATWALAHAIYPGEIFAPDESIVANFCQLLDRLDDKQGIPAETGWMPYKGLWPYSASFYAHVWMVAGNGVKPADYLYGFANHAAPTRVWREEQHFHDSYHYSASGDMPHNWASAEFIRLVRNVLVFEYKSELHLLAGMPEEWIVPGSPIVVEQTPTRYGPVSLHFEMSQTSELQLKLTMNPTWSQRPLGVYIHMSAFHSWSNLERINFNGHLLTAQSIIEVPLALIYE